MNSLRLRCKTIQGVNENELLNLQAIKTILKGYNDMSDEHVQLLLNTVDKDKDGLVSVQELHNFVARHRDQQKASVE